MDDTQLLLKRISDGLGSVDFQNLKHLCHGKIPLGDLERATRPTDLFTLMRQRRYIKPGNLDFLEHLLNCAARQDLAAMIRYKGRDSTMETESAASVRSLSSTSVASSSDLSFRTLLNELSDELTRDNVESLKFMTVLPEAYNENVKSGKDFFGELIRRGKIGPTQVDLIIELLTVIHRKDLAMKVEDFKLEQERQPLRTPVLETSPGQLMPAAPLQSLTTSPKKGPVSNTMLMTPEDFTGPGRSQEPRFPVQARSEGPDDILAGQIRDVYIEDVEDAMPAYASDRRPRGIALIISNEVFEDGNPAQLRNRNGTARDEENLKGLWQKLHFEVQIKKNLKAYEIYNTMREISAGDHSNYDCFVCCLLSHGANGGIYGIDAQLVEIREITAQFKGTACPSLSDKPKLFFIQACRGQEFDRGALESDAVTTDAMKHSAEPNESHFLLGYATPPGQPKPLRGCLGGMSYVSWRSQVHGSWYVSKLCEVFHRFCERCDVMTMMVKVNDEVSEAFTKQGYKQCPAPVVTLRKRVVFKNN